MKKILSIILLFIAFLSPACAQQLKVGDYIPNPGNKRFEGVWKVKDETSSLTIIFKNHEKVYSQIMDVYFDFLEGEITYVKNGETIFDHKRAIINGTNLPEDPYSLIATLSDLKGISAGLTISFPDKKDLNVMLITASPRGNNKRASLRFPRKIILKKQ